ncbi:MAG: sugar phosphate isomerase/epimerase [Fimbriimonadaceae bacterium]|nr:MAG: sugar phosphate isomerase/epimerase [Fimbriimonadaceae bacterium]
MPRTYHQDIRIGTLAKMPGCLDYLPQILPHGFESFQLTNWAALPDDANTVDGLKELAAKTKDVLGGKAIIDSVGIYGNPLTDQTTADHWAILIEAAPAFGATTVCGFTGCIEAPVDENIDRFKEIFAPLTKLAEDNGVKIAFENCDMGGTWEKPNWNIAHSPRAWEMMFNAVDSDYIGLEWEPCHQMVSLIDPLPQLRKWIGKIYHIHGKDASINWDKLKTDGLRCGEWFVHHRTPGFGDTNWTDLISILRHRGWTGCIDIEGWHDPVYRDDLEMTGQVYSLNYLKQCRGGDFIPNPK